MSVMATRIPPAFLLALYVAAPVQASNATNLKGLREFTVLIEGISPAAKQAGLTPEMLRSDVEQRLRRANIRVLSAEESHSKQRTYIAPAVYVAVTAMQRKDLPHLIIYSVHLAAAAWVTIHPSGREALGEIWRKEEIGAVGEERFVEIVKHSVANRVDMLITDLLSVSR